jgi:hypothetical protein
MNLGLTLKKLVSEIYIGKIYSVSNYISRFQPNNGVENRNITGIKSVDECAGDKTPFHIIE